MLKNRDGYLVPCDWEDALSVVAERVCPFDSFFLFRCLFIEENFLFRLVEQDLVQK